MPDQRKSTSYRIGRLQKLSTDQPLPTLNLSSTELRTISNTSPVAIGQIPLEPEARVLVLHCGNAKLLSIVGDHNALIATVQSKADLNDRPYNVQFYPNAKFPPLVLPVRSNDVVRVLYWIFGYSAPLAFSNHLIDNWVRLAQDVENAYRNFDGFVICMDKKYLCKCASALSFLFHHLGKPVILTSFEDPQRSNDRDNLSNSIRVAGSLDIPEVCILLNGKLSRANRCTVSSDLRITSVLPPLAVVSEEKISVSWHAVFRSHYPNVFNTRIYLSTNVVRLRLTDTTTIEEVKRWALDDAIVGFVLVVQTGQNDEDLKEIVSLLKAAVDRGHTVMICADYQTSIDPSLKKALLENGALDGQDMTSETALIKMAYVMERPDWIGEMKKKALQSTLRGEISIDQPPVLRDLELIKQFADFMNLTNESEIELLRQTLYPPLVFAAANDGNLSLFDVLSQTARNEVVFAVMIVNNLLNNTLKPANLCAVNYDLRTALHVAASQGNADVVQYLLDVGVSVNRRDIFNDTPLVGAIKNKHLAIVKMLIKAGAQLNLPTVTVGTTLCEVVCKNDLVLLRAWKLGGADFNCGDYDGRTPLHIAASIGHLDIATFLLDNGAQPDVTDHMGNTPLSDAKRNGHKSVAALLLQYNMKIVQYITIAPNISSAS